MDSEFIAASIRKFFDSTIELKFVTLFKCVVYVWPQHMSIMEWATVKDKEKFRASLPNFRN